MEKNDYVKISQWIAKHITTPAQDLNLSMRQDWSKTVDGHLDYHEDIIEILFNLKQFGEMGICGEQFSSLLADVLFRLRSQAKEGEGPLLMKEILFWCQQALSQNASNRRAQMVEVQATFVAGHKEKSTALFQKLSMPPDLFALKAKYIMGLADAQTDPTAMLYNIAAKTTHFGLKQEIFSQISQQALKAQDYASARKALLEAVKIAPNSVHYHGNLSKCHKELGDYTAAIESCQKALAIQDDPRLQEWLKVLQEQASQSESKNKPSFIKKLFGRS